MASDKLVISLLGPPALSVGAKNLHIKRRMFRYFVFYLACQPEPVSRESLCELFWPMEDENQSRKNLREMISKLRRELPIDGLFITEKELVSFDKSKVEVDVLKFEETTTLLRNKIGILESSDLSDSFYLKIQDAFHLWRTDRFLGGMSTTGPEPFQYWVINTGEALQYWRQRMIEWMADHCIASGNLHEALNWLSLAREYDPTNTELNLLSLTCLRDLNNWSEAMRFCALLENEYSGSDEREIPLPLKDLIYRVRQEADNPHDPPQVVWESQFWQPDKFVGRKEYLRELNNALNRGDILLVQGEAGSGKSRLLREFYEKLEASPRLIYLRARPGYEKEAYRSIIEPLRKVITIDEWKSVDPVDAKVLSPFFPELIKNRSDIDYSDLFEHSENERLVRDAFLNLAKIIAAKKKCLFVLDDAHFCDDESVKLFFYIQEHVKPFQVGSVVYSVRSEVFVKKYEQLLGGNYHSEISKTIKLLPFSEDEVSDYVYQNHGQKISSKLTSRLERLSGGNPRYLNLITNCLAKTLTDFEDLLASPSFPFNASLREAIRNNLAECSPIGKQILTEIAIFGDQIQPAFLEKILVSTEDSLLVELQDLCTQRILEVVNFVDKNSEYRFTHGIEAEYIQSTMDPATQRTLHLKATKLIIDYVGDGNEQAARLAFHFQSAGELRDALQYWIRAGKFAKDKRNKEEAYNFFKKAYDLEHKIGSSVSEEDIYELTNEWGDLALQLDDMDTFSTVSLNCLKEGELRGSKKLIGFGLSGLGWITHSRGNFEIAIEFLDQAIIIFTSIADAIDLADAYLRKGAIFIDHQDYLKATENLEKILESPLVFVINRGMPVYIKASAFLAFVYCHTGKLAKGLGIIEDSLEIAQSLNETNYTLQIKASKAMTWHYLGENAKIQEEIRSILPEIQSLNLDWWWINLQTVSAFAALNEGDLNTTWATISQIIAFDDHENSQGRRDNLANYLKGLIFLHLRNLEMAEIQFSMIQADWGDRSIWLMTKIALAKIALDKENLQKSQGIIEETLLEADEHGLAFISGEAKLILADILFHQRKNEGFLSEIEKLEIEMKNCEYPLLQQNLMQLKAKAAFLTGKEDEGIQYFDLAFKESLKSQHVWMQLSICEQIALSAMDKKLASRYTKHGKRIIERMFLSCEVAELEDSLKNLLKLWSNWR